MTDEVTKPKGKPGRKPKAAVETVEKVETVQEAPVEAVEVAETVDVTEGTTETVETQEGTVEAQDVAETATVEADSATPEQDIEATPEEAAVVAGIYQELGLATETPEAKPLGLGDPNGIVNVEYTSDHRLMEAVESMEQLERIVVTLADTFKPILRPSSVAGEPKGHMPCPKAVFDLVTKDADWRSKIDSHPAKVALQSVAYWQDQNGEQQVRCMSSSKFGKVL